MLRVRRKSRGNLAAALAPACREYFAPAFRARRSDIGQNRSREMFDVTTSLAFPSKRPFFFGMIEQPQRLQGDEHITAL
jgi:hypothetical protein